jgi:hypothetical protein
MLDDRHKTYFAKLCLVFGAPDDIEETSGLRDCQKALEDLVTDKSNPYFKCLTLLPGGLHASSAMSKVFDMYATDMTYNKDIEDLKSVTETLASAGEFNFEGKCMPFKLFDLQGKAGLFDGGLVGGVFFPTPPRPIPLVQVHTAPQQPDKMHRPLCR